MIAGNRQEFFNHLRTSSLFSGHLSETQVTGIEAIVDEWNSQAATTLTPDVSQRQIAYILGTVYRESGPNMYPVREGFAKDDAGAIAHVKKMFDQGFIRRNYALLDPVTHKSYFGRGFVQLTWADNYKHIGQLIGQDLYNHPELALEPKISAEIAVRGMKGGWFTGVGLSKYINETTNDVVNARRIINGTDVATLVAGYSSKFLDSIKAS